MLQPKYMKMFLAEAGQIASKYALKVQEGYSIQSILRKELIHNKYLNYGLNKKVLHIVYIKLWKIKNSSRSDKC